MIDKVIVCDKCGCEDCSVSEVLPESEKISMKNFAAQGKGPYDLGSWSHSEQRTRTYVVSCPKCDHSIEYHVHPKQPHPFYSGAENHV